MKHLNYLYMILAALCLATIGVLVKLIGDSVPVMSLNFLRISIGFVALLLIVPFIDKTWYKLTRRDAIEFFLRLSSQKSHKLTSVASGCPLGMG